MKRCNVCGNIGDDESTVCSICGNPLTEADLILEPDEKSEPGVKADSEPDLTVTSDIFESENNVGPGKRSSEPEGAPDLQETTASVRKKTLSIQGTETPVTDAAVSAKKAAVSAKAAAASARAAAASAREAAESAKEAATAPEAAVSGDTAVPVKKNMPAGKTAASSPNNEAASAAEKPDGAKPAAHSVSDKNLSGQPENAGASAQRPARPRRTRSGPQIYGQDSMTGYNGAQGVIRRDVQGGHTVGGAQPVSEGSSRTGRGGTEGAADRRRGTSQVPDRTVSSGKERSGRGESASDMRQNRPVNQQPGVQGRQANMRQAAPVNRSAAGQPQAQRAVVPPYAQVPQGDRQQAIKMSTTRKVLEAAKDALASPMLIIIALLYTVYFVSNIAAIFLRQLNFSQIARLLTMFSFPSQLNGYISMFQAAMSQLDKGALALNLVIRLPELVFCLGLWLLIATVRSSGEQISGIGFLLLRIVVIAEMIVACVILLVVLVVSVTLVIAAWSAGTQGLIVVAVVTLVASIIISMAVLMYYFCYLATIKTVQMNARTGERYGKVSVYVAVVHIVLAFTGIISILSGIVNLEITGITVGVSQIGWMVLFGIWILRYRSSMSEYAE